MLEIEENGKEYLLGECCLDNADLLLEIILLKPQPFSCKRFFFTVLLQSCIKTCKVSNETFTIL